MTTGESAHDDECVKALEKVFLFLDNEMDEEDSDKIRHHLDECEPCLEKYDLEVMVRTLVARSCTCEQAPSELRRKIMTKIREVQTEIGRGNS